MAYHLLRHIPDVRDTFEFDEVYKVSQRTLDIYRHNLTYFNDWLNEHSSPSDDLPIPVETIRGYMLHLTGKGYRLNTIKQRFWAIAWLHDINGFSDSKNPVYHPDFRKINRKIALALARQGVSNKPRQKTPLKAADVKSLASLCPRQT